MIAENIYSALKVLTDRLSDSGIDWVLVGSTSLAMQGMDFNPGDIDVLTDKDGAFAINNLLKDFITEGVSLKENGKFESYIGSFKINGVQVEVMGDLQIKDPEENPWVEADDFPKKTLVQYKDLRIPCFDLEHEYLAYSRMGRKEKADKIRKFLDQGVSS